MEDKIMLALTSSNGESNTAYSAVRNDYNTSSYIMRRENGVQCSTIVTGIVRRRTADQLSGEECERRIRNLCSFAPIPGSVRLSVCQSRLGCVPGGTYVSCTVTGGGLGSLRSPPGGAALSGRSLHMNLLPY
ncbi:hypothetical protein J6590_016215 [Homalodisca vitripennis]|nr:hypothetical protein J6590_016215 [Homalodisca vitripennis]